MGISAFIRCARGVEAAGNSGRSSGTNALQVRQTAQDFWQGVRPLVASIERRRLSDRQKPVSRLKVRRELPALAAQRRAFSVFERMWNKSPSSQSRASRNARQCPTVWTEDPDLRPQTRQSGIATLHSAPCLCRA